MRRARRVLCVVAAATTTVAATATVATSGSSAPSGPAPVHSTAVVADQHVQVSRTKVQLATYEQRIRQLRTQIAMTERTIRRGHR